MSVKIYVVDDPILISFIEDNDLDGFKEYLDSDDTLMFGEPETIILPDFQTGTQMAA
jgi:hypothetical protein